MGTQPIGERGHHALVEEQNSDEVVKDVVGREKLKRAITPDEVMSDACALNDEEIRLVNVGINELTWYIKEAQGEPLLIPLLRHSSLHSQYEASNSRHKNANWWHVARVLAHGHMRRVMKRLLEEAGWEVTEKNRWIGFFNTYFFAVSGVPVSWPWCSCWVIRPSLDYVMKSTPELVNEKAKR